MNEAIDRRDATWALTKTASYNMALLRPLTIVRSRDAVNTLPDTGQDVSVPSVTIIQSILDAVDQSITDNKSVFVHCWGGRGRTGTVVGCWLARHGRATGDQALALINDLRKNDPTRFQPSPETEEQRRMVKAWKIGQ